MMSDVAERSGRTDGRRHRRLWSADEKQAMLAESFAPGTSVANVAQRHGVNANLLFTWRRQLAAKSPAESGKMLELAPVTVVTERATPEARDGDGDAARSAGRMEIVLAGGERIIVGADVDAAALARVVRALSRR
jgi:transposase